MKALTYIAWFASVATLAFAQDNRKAKASSAAAAGGDAAAVKAVDAAHEAYVAGMRANDSAAIAKLVAPDVVYYPPNGAPLMGAAAVREWYQASFDAAKITAASVADRTVTFAGDRAIENGKFSISLAPVGGGAPVEDRGVFMATWQRQADGSWKVARNIWNSSIPLPPTVATTPAQSKSRVVRLAYMNVEPAKVSEYLKRIREHYVPINNARVSEGKVTSWKAYQVAYPNGEAPEYNFVLMVELPSMAMLEGDGTFAATAKKVVGTEKYEHVIANPIAKTMRVDTLLVRDATQNWSNATNRILNVAYLRALPGKTAELVAIKRDHYVPSTEDSVKAGRMTSWGLGVLRFPEQRDYPYTHLSIAGYESMAQMEQEAPAQLREKWGAKSAEAMAKLPAVRTRVKGELWRLVEQTKLAATPKPGT